MRWKNRSGRLGRLANAAGNWQPAVAEKGQVMNVINVNSALCRPSFAELLRIALAMESLFQTWSDSSVILRMKPSGRGFDSQLFCCCALLKRISGNAGFGCGTDGNGQ